MDNARQPKRKSKSLEDKLDKIRNIRLPFSPAKWDMPGINWVDVLIIVVLVVVAIVIGVIGYRVLYGSAWIDAFYESSMMLAGVGPLTNPTTNSGKIFVAFYAVFCSLVIIAIIGYVISQLLQATGV